MNRREKTVPMTVTVVDCDECGKELWELEAHRRYPWAWWDEEPVTRDDNAPHRDLCGDCCDGGCIDGQNAHG